MKLSYDAIKSFKINSIDEKNIGKIDDFLFNDLTYEIKHLVLRCGNWLTGDYVLVRPSNLIAIHPERREIDIGLTKIEIEAHPSRSSAETASDFAKTLKDLRFSRDYALSNAYTAFAGWGHVSTPLRDYSPDLTSFEERTNDSIEQFSFRDSNHLRSCEELSGYKLLDYNRKEVGNVDELILDIASGKLQYLVANTGSWLKNKLFLVSTDWINRIDAGTHTIELSLKKDRIEECPHYEQSAPINANQETILHDFYGRPYYWRASSTYNIGKQDRSNVQKNKKEKQQHVY
ncbi:PRC-barrel domain containing protein [bacterium]|nr:PRC-barrel domain containing protein [bacterium]